jgi:hypothetical protein
MGMEGVTILYVEQPRFRLIQKSVDQCGALQPLQQRTFLMQKAKLSKKNDYGANICFSINSF